MIPFVHALGNDLGAVYFVVIKIAPVSRLCFQDDTARLIVSSACDRSVVFLVLDPDFILTVCIFTVFQTDLLPRKGRQRVSADILIKNLFPLCAVVSQIGRIFPAV